MKDLSHIPDDAFKEVQDDSKPRITYVTVRKMDRGEQAHKWRGIFKKIAITLFEGKEIKNYYFTSSEGDFAIGANKLVEDRMSPYRIGDCIQMEFKGMKAPARGGNKYGDLHFRVSPEGSLTKEEFDKMMESILEDEKEFPIPLSLRVDQPYPSFEDSDVPF